MSVMVVKQTAGRDPFGELAPKFAELNDDVLFGEVWSREGGTVSARLQSGNCGGIDGSGIGGFFFSVPSGKCEEERNHQNRDCRAPHPRCLLCGRAPK